MNDAKHTPDDWQVIDNGETITIADKKGDGICRLLHLTKTSRRNLAEVMENAKLLVNAPALLAALEEIHSGVRDKGLSADEILGIAGNAIRAAKGE